VRAGGRALLVAGFCALAVLPACGEDEPDGVSPEEYRAEVEAICAEAEREREALPEPTTLEAYPEFLEQGIAQQRRFLDRLQSVEPPPPDAQELRDRWLRPFETRTIELERAVPEIAEAAGSGDAERTATLLRQARPDPSQAASVSSFLISYGLPECADYGSGT
jgi:hypothetical protein